MITDTNKLSKIQNTEISYLTGYDIDLNNEYLIFGSVNFHQTNLEIDNGQKPINQFVKKYVQPTWKLLYEFSNLSSDSNFS